jgi:nucleoside-diphosphate-sugar epimerase
MTRPDSSGPTVLVTGASGLIGSRLVHELGRDHRVVAMDRLDPGEEHPGPSIHVPVDLTCDESTEDAVRRVTAQCGGDEVASVIHLAATSPPTTT